MIADLFYRRFHAGLRIRLTQGMTDRDSTRHFGHRFSCHSFRMQPKCQFKFAKTAPPLQAFTGPVGSKPAGPDPSVDIIHTSSANRRRRVVAFLRSCGVMQRTLRQQHAPARARASGRPPGTLRPVPAESAQQPGKPAVHGLLAPQRPGHDADQGSAISTPGSGILVRLLLSNETRPVDQ